MALTPSALTRRKALFLGVGGVLAGVTGCSSGSGTSSAPATAPRSSVASSATASAGGSVPTSLKIPSIGFDKGVAGLGLAPTGELSPPRGVTQWYNATVSPGRPGISVIAGHVSYDDVPDVFADLATVRVGDPVTVGFADGSRRTFVVTRKKSVEKNALRRDQSVWGRSATPVLALITCDGRSEVVGAHHVNNVVVWAEPSSVGQKAS